MAHNFKMPKNRAEFEKSLELAFKAGCTHGYAVVHNVDVAEQEKLGAFRYLGKITYEEYNERMEELLK